MLNIPLTSFFSAKKTYLEDLSQKDHLFPEYTAFPGGDAPPLNSSSPIAGNLFCVSVFANMNNAAITYLYLHPIFYTKEKWNPRDFFICNAVPSLCSSSNDLREAAP